MVTIDSLRESLRAQLATLIDLYEAETSGAAVGLCEVPAVRLDMVPSAGMRESTAPSDGSTASSVPEPDPVSVVERCLRDFAAAIAAAEAAGAASVDAHGAAAGLLQRAADGRAVALMMRRDAEKRMRDIALGRVVPAFEAHRLAEAQAAARMSAVLSRQSDARASAACRHAREAAQCAVAALAAAARADPSFSDGGFDPARCAAALLDAQAASARATGHAVACTDHPPLLAMPAGGAVS